MPPPPNRQTRQRWLPLLLLALASVSLVTYWRAPLSADGNAQPAINLDAATLLSARRRAHSVAAPFITNMAAPTHTMAPAPAAAPAPSTATIRSIASRGGPSAVGGMPFSPGQSEQARASVRMAIEKQRPPPGQNELWGSNQAGWDQAHKESNNVRMLLQADGMPSWRADTSRLPPRRPANASMEQLLEHVPIGGSAWLAFGNAGVSEMLMNWAHHVIALGHGDKIVVAAFDVPLLETLHMSGIPAYNYSGALPPTHFRHAPYLFHRMGFLKAELIVHVLRTGRHALVSDSDVAWVADPTPLLAEMHALGANMGSSTDCLDVNADRDKSTRATSPVMCGHAPGNRGGAIFNTGVLWFAASEPAINFAKRWAAETLALTDPYSDDQGVFNRIMTNDMYPVRAYSDDGRVIHGPMGLRIAPLPAERFCSGHYVHVQRGSHTDGCLSVHATFTEYGDAGKRWRFLESKLWALNEPSYYSEGRYLTFVPPRPPADPMPCVGEEGKYVLGQTPNACGGEDPSHGLGPKRFGDIMWTEALKRSTRLRANQEIMSRQTHALRDALAIARVLNRTLILPHYECLCDRSEDVAVVPSCVYHGAPPRLQMPFFCSQHFVADTHKLQMMSLDPTKFGMQPHKFNGVVTPPLKIRAFSFLEDERTHPDIRNGIVDVGVGGVTAAGTSGGGVALARMATNDQVLEQLEKVAHARVLRLSDAEGAFSGWVSQPTQAKLFATLMEYYVHRGAWCCSSRNQAQQDDGRVYVRRPPELRMPRGA